MDSIGDINQNIPSLRWKARRAAAVRGRLLSGTTALAILACPAALRAQTAAAAPGADAAGAQEVVITGSILRRTSKETPSPVTTLSADAIDKRGLTTISDAIRSISADSAGSISPAFSNGFGAGGSGVSLRGLSVNSTLVLFDGLRGTNYPLADDGERSYTDLNTIPDAIVDHIEVLKDGASSVYGSDAIAGVVNVFIKKQITGVEGRAEGGISQQGDGGHQRLALSAGYGDLARDGWNFYVSGEYTHDGIIHTRDRGFPYNTKDLTSIGGDNGNMGATGAGATTVAIVRPATESIPGNILTGTPTPGSLWRPLGGSCGDLVTHVFTVGTVCEQNIAGQFATLQPEQTRYGATAHLTVDLGGDSQAYAIGTYYRSKVHADFVPNTLQGTQPQDFGHVVLPARLTNGQLNPNDPFAAQGLDALIEYRFGDTPYARTYTNQTFRGAAGVSGSFGDGWHYSVDVTGMKSRLDDTFTGFLNIAAITDAIKTGSYDFVDPSRNSQAVRDAVAPDIRTVPKTSLYLAQASLSKAMFELPGGPLQVGVGAAIRREHVDSPGQNPDLATLSINNFSAIGTRTVKSAYFELSAPVLAMLDVEGSGRYEHYSQGFNNFSPKLGFKFTPSRALAFRGTWSLGFRAPSIPETTGTVLGYGSSTPPPPDVVAAHHGDVYVLPYRIGLISAGTPGLDPEKSRSFTLGTIFQPTRMLSFTVDYYNIRKRHVIVSGTQNSDAIAAYYAGKPLPAGYTVDANLPDSDYPNAVSTIAFLHSPYVNAASAATAGIDYQAEGRFQLGDKARFTSSVEVTQILYSNLTDVNGTQHYVGTEGPVNLSASDGTPRWKGNWQNTLELGKVTLTGTAYYVSGYRETAEDAGGVGTSHDCSTAAYGSTPAIAEKFCHVKDFVHVDLVGNYAVSDRFAIYLHVVNLFGAHAPLNPANYGVGNNGANYNAAYAQDGVIGRFFRAGATFKF